ncbi:MAG: hypothetical protein DMG04_06020 [Acidobacteria bacterium]|nr:MAG: hypothetical protein DMG04_06020 [Acidobacteriota bacterium]PYQ90269.1 MAG: hypothetical protein DMG03_00820 [Acidobacteriota bacterium]PYQ92202.1 MAG: hypothetical protein DMG02_02020 [Acidobacteriota bacterium]PYR10900.1 MAG: hypothetical protein DMF99_10190 [Acidobacteriota bacterium]
MRLLDEELRFVGAEGGQSNPHAACAAQDFKTAVIRVVDESGEDYIYPRRDRRRRGDRARGLRVVRCRPCDRIPAPLFAKLRLASQL